MNFVFGLRNDFEYEWAYPFDADIAGPIDSPEHIPSGGLVQLAHTYEAGEMTKHLSCDPKVSRDG